MVWQFLTDDDRRMLTAALAELEMARGGQTTRTVLLNLAGLARFIDGLAALADAAAYTFAAELVQALENGEPQMPDATRQPLGMLLDYVGSLPDTPQTTTRLAATVIERYGLLDEADDARPQNWRTIRRRVEADGQATTDYVPPTPPSPDELSDPGPLPPGHRLPYDRNPLFTGREEELRAIARAVLYAPAALPAVISTGIGGVGKTQLAVEFAYRYGRYFHGAHWVSLADPNPDVIAAEMVACGLAMGLWPPEQDAALTTGEKLDRIRQAWAGPEPRLVIFDNCEDRALLEEWRPRGGGARALVTSRDDTWPAGYQRLPVRTLPRAESRSLLREYLDPAGRAEPDAALDAVAEALGDLPLALILAGSTLSAYPELTVERYLADLDQPDLLRRLLPDEDARPASWTKHDLDVARTFALGLERLRPDDGTDADARLMLAAATCLIHGEPFPRALLTGILPGDDPRPAGRAVNRLLALGLLERSGAETLRLHRLPARFAAGALAEGMDTARAAVERAVIGLSYEQTGTGDPRRLRDWEIHLRHVTDAARGREDETAATLCNNFGYYL
ncbi:MAG: hypothetical protein KJ046_17790, partial [Anaerolineae bacterium]|nr:hypothetical protein [Anaerolineae bacterium]